MLQNVLNSVRKHGSYMLKMFLLPKQLNFWIRFYIFA